MVLYRYWTGHDTIIIIWMYTSILGNKQSTINRYMVFFFPFHIRKKVWGHKLGNSTIIKLVHDSNFSLPRFDTSHSWWTNKEQTPEQNRKKTRGRWLALLGFHSSSRTNCLFLLFNAEWSLGVVMFHIRTSACGVRSQSAEGIQNNGETRQLHSHHALHQDLQDIIRKVNHRILTF